MSVTLAEVTGAAGIIAMLIAVDGWVRNRHLKRQDNKLEEIHVLVNSRLTEALERITVLEEALREATGIPKEMIESKVAEKIIESKVAEKDDTS